MSRRPIFGKPETASPPPEPDPWDQKFWLSGALPGPAQLERWLDLEDAASPGPWLAYNPSTHPDQVGKNWDIVFDSEGAVSTWQVHASEMSYHGDDLAFIAAARTAVPALLALVRHLQGEVERLKLEAWRP